jgi:hypothetical protein
MMQPDVQMRKSRGRLSRHVQHKLGETLHAMFDEIVKEGVPDRFATLLDRLEDNNKGLRAAQNGEPAESFTDSNGREPSKPDRLLRAKGEDKGSS